MKVVCLVSGGKDSTYSALRCLEEGHELVCLANLYPAEAGRDDLDSWMYQTVGHNVIEAYSACTGLPLVRRAITGGSRDTSLSYLPTAGDEVEDLAELLAHCRLLFPELQAVCSGAIASDYQRIRVERVCARLGLTSLSYLWHEPQSLLLDGMIAAGIEAILIKTAAEGLIPARHLGLTLSDARQHLWALRGRFGSNMCGEGGEYETLTLDCPLFKHFRIVLTETDKVIVSSDPVCPVGFLHVVSYRLDPKGADAGPGPRIHSANDPIPAAGPGPTISPAPAPATTEGADFGLDVELSANQSSSGLSLYCTVARPQLGGQAAGAGPAGAEVTAAAVGAALRAVLEDGLRPRGLGWADVAMVHLYVGNMAHFARANEAYIRVIPLLDPPSRVCVELPLAAAAPGRVLAVEAIAPRCRTPRGPLHVQSISRWAPACIGPYAQANVAGDAVFLSGQIPLHPATMAVVGQDTWPTVARHGGPSWLPMTAQLERTLLSCQRVAVAVGAALPSCALSLSLFYSRPGTSTSNGRLLGEGEVAEVGRVMGAFLSGQSMEPAPRGGGAAAAELSSRGEGHEELAVEEEEDEEEADFLGLGKRWGGAGVRDEGLGRPVPRQPEWDREFLDLPGSAAAAALAAALRPSVLALGVPALPRASLVEVQPFALKADALGARAGEAGSRELAAGGGAGVISASHVSFLSGTAAVQHVFLGAAVLGASLGEAAREVQGAVAEAAAQAGLSPADVLVARLYYSTGEAAGTWAEGLAASLLAGGLRCAAVPVLEVGRVVAARGRALEEGAFSAEVPSFPAALEIVFWGDRHS